MAFTLPTSSTDDYCSPVIHPEEMKKISRLLEDRAGFRLCIYKPNCVTRRINIRIRATNSGTPKDYCSLLENDERELKRLIKTLTIHVSQFFRNRPVYDLLRDSILPELFSRKAGNDLLDLWSAGCSTGEEPYTLAILLKEFFPAEMARTPVRIIATDINADILEQARAGLYVAEKLSEVPPHLVQRYFTPDSGKFRINEDIRGMVTFLHEDIFSPGCKRRSDMIVCRNVMIYFERLWQEEMQKEFAESLAGGGFLVLGKSESIVGASRRFFHLVSPLERIYREGSR